MAQLCSCFGRRKKDEPKSRNEDDQNQNPAPSGRKKLQPTLSVLRGYADSEPILFNFDELKTATMNFNDKIGHGGFGSVYKGKLQRTGQTVAVKVLNLLGSQGEREFLSETIVLTMNQHPNLVRLIGYCTEGDERVLVYEYMPLGTLKDHIHTLESGLEPLDWTKRMQIALGAATGLSFLHNVCDPPVIYRDLKPSNVLMDESFIPKLSDFGLAKFRPSTSDELKGSFGFMAPEYIATRISTFKCDVYSFGMLMMELITGITAVEVHRKEFLKLAGDVSGKGYLMIADPFLEGRAPEDTLLKAVQIANGCLVVKPDLRSSIEDVLPELTSLVNQLTDRSSPGEREGGESSKEKNSEDREGDTKGKAKCTS